MAQQVQNLDPRGPMETERTEWRADLRLWRFGEQGVQSRLCVQYKSTKSSGMDVESFFQSRNVKKVERILQDYHVPGIETRFHTEVAVDNLQLLLAS